MPTIRKSLSLNDQRQQKHPSDETNISNDSAYKQWLKNPNPDKKVISRRKEPYYLQTHLSSAPFLAWKHKKV